MREPSDQDGDDRSRALSAARRRLDEGIVDDARVLDQISDDSGVSRETLVQRWISAVSVYTDFIQDRRVALPDYPHDAAVYSQMSTLEVLGALSDQLAQVLTDLPDSDGWQRNALGITVAYCRTRNVWQDHITEVLDRWAELVRNSSTRPGKGINHSDLVDASKAAVNLVASHHYTQMILGRSEVDASITTAAADRIVQDAITET